MILVFGDDYFCHYQDSGYKYLVTNKHAFKLKGEMKWPEESITRCTKGMRKSR